MSDQVKMLHSVVSLDYERPPTLVAREYMAAIRQQRLIAHKCPECERIYTPPRGYCPICVVPTEKEHEIELSPQGTLVTYTVLNPDALQQQGGTSTSRGNVMLDGTKISITGDLLDVEPDQVHTGMRMKAVWTDLTDEDVANLRGGGGWGTPGIKGWQPSGEPDVPPAEVQRLLAEAGAE